MSVLTLLLAACPDYEIAPSAGAGVGVEVAPRIHLDLQRLDFGGLGEGESAEAPS